jgi:hypothetical protein
MEILSVDIIHSLDKKRKHIKIAILLSYLGSPRFIS